MEQPSPFILELSNQIFDETKAIMFSHHLFSYSKIQKLNMVMTIKDIVMLNLTNGKGVALKISTPHPRGDNATRSHVTTLPSFTKGRGAKDHAIGTPYVVSQKTTSKELRFRPGDLQGSSPINLVWELKHKYT